MHSRAVVLLTGASGFVGQALNQRLADDGVEVLALARRANLPGPTRWKQVFAYSGLRDTLQSVDCVVHLAARVHVMHERAADPLAQFRATNVAMTLALAREAAAAGVRRFVFVSTVKVHGETSNPGKPFSVDSPFAPQDPYAVSKAEAEQGLYELARQTGMELVIMRPPLVYGPGAKANFGSLMRAVSRGWPLPVGAIHNARSLVGLDNLVDAVALCIQHPAAANQTFFVSDGHDVSIRELVVAMALAAGRPARLIGVPPALIRLGLAMVGRQDVALRLLGNLQVDISKLRNALGWTPPVSLEVGLRKAFADGAHP